VNKIQIRQKILKKRKKNFFKNFSFNSQIFLKKFENKFKNKSIGGYYPHNYEINPLDILKKLEKKKYKISLPKVSKNNQMNFFKWSFDDPLAVNIYGIPEPISENLIYPDVLFVPLVAFDNELNRLGYGGGYYDRYLSRIKKNKKIITIGMGYSFQKLQRLPTNQHDMKLDYVVTEKDFFQ